MARKREAVRKSELKQTCREGYCLLGAKISAHLPRWGRSNFILKIGPFEKTHFEKSWAKTFSPDDDRGQTIENRELRAEAKL